jgi:hypothetical protein
MSSASNASRPGDGSEGDGDVFAQQARGGPPCSRAQPPAEPPVPRRPSLTPSRRRLPPAAAADARAAAAASSSDDDVPLGAAARRRTASASASASSSDEEPLSRGAARRAVEPPAPVGRAAAAAPPPAAPRPAAPAPSGRVRNQVFKRARTHEKCGKCINCLNPQRKQACEAVRAAQEREAAEAAAAERRAAEAAEDPFLRALRGVLAASGGVALARHAPRLLDLVARAEAPAHRHGLALVLARSGAEVQRELVRGGALLALQRWLAAALEERRPKAAARLLDALDALPVTVAALQPPCQLGKLVGRLARGKAELAADDLRARAQRVVDKWKALVDVPASSRLLAPPHNCICICRCRRRRRPRRRRPSAPPVIRGPRAMYTVGGAVPTNYVANAIRHRQPRRRARRGPGPACAPLPSPDRLRRAPPLVAE